MKTQVFPPIFSRHLFRSVCGALALLVATPVNSECTRWTIDQLMQAMQEIRSDQARFTERKSIAMLEEPVDSSGELSYTAPDRMEKRTLKPKPESMILDGDSLVFERGGKKRRFQLQETPELAAFITSIRGILAGDRAALEQNYGLSLEGSAADWTLQLLPLDEKIHGVVTSIRISGAGNAVHTIETLQADGDSSLMLIERQAAR
jgi:outer membrane lipoprotein-sorting protein